MTMSGDIIITKRVPKSRRRPGKRYWWRIKAATVPRRVARVAAPAAITSELSAAVIKPGFCQSLLYQSRVKPFQASEYLELLKEKIATITSGR